MADEHPSFWRGVDAPLKNINTAFLSFAPIHSNPYHDAQVVSLPQGPVINAGAGIGSPHTFVAAIDFVADDVYTLDLSSLLTNNPPKHGIQSMYINAANMLYGSCTVTLTGYSTRQVVVIEAGTQGYYPLICQKTGPLVVSFENSYGWVSAGKGVSCSIDAHFMTVPVVAAVWAATIGQNQPTTRALQLVTNSDGLPTPVKLADRPYCWDFLNPGPATQVTINPVAIGAKRYYVRKIQLSFDPTCGGGNNYVYFADSFEGVIWGNRFSFPVARPASPIADVRTISTGEDFYYESLSTNSTLGFYMFTTLQGAVTVNIQYGAIH